MAQPFVFATTHRVKPGREADLDALAAEYTRFLDVHEPDLAALGVCGGDGELALVHVLADAAAADRHLELAGPVIHRAIELVDNVAIHVYGDPGPLLRKALDANAENGVSITVRPAALGGFLRS